MVHLFKEQVSGRMVQWYGPLPLEEIPLGAHSGDDYFLGSTIILSRVVQSTQHRTGACSKEIAI